SRECPDSCAERVVWFLSSPSTRLVTLVAGWGRSCLYQGHGSKTGWDSRLPVLSS
ncbi:hypothetical protein BDZ89DRAFT_1063938, partial [Hymenopellis radicata]